MIEEKQAFKETAFDQISQEIQKTNDVFESVQGDLASATTDSTAKKESPEVEPKKARSARSEETGFAVTVQNLRLLKERIASFGDTYVQGSPLYTLENIQAVYDAAIERIDEFNTSKQADDMAIDNLNIVFQDLEKDATRTKNLFVWCGVPQQAVKRMEYLNHQIQGTRVAPLDANSTDAHISAAHTSRTQQIQHVREMVTFLPDYPEFIPPAAINTAAWATRLAAMDSAQLAQNITSSNVKMKRVKRNIAIYKKETGVVEIGLGAKRTVLGIYGFNSPEYAMVKGIKFTRIKGWENL